VPQEQLDRERLISSVESLWQDIDDVRAALAKFVAADATLAIVAEIRALAPQLTEHPANTHH